MIYSIEFSPRSVENLDEIYFYIAFKIGQPQTATSQITRILEGITSLNYMPERNVWIHSFEQELGKIHVQRIDNYLVLYRVLKECKSVRVLSVVYYRRDLNRILTEERNQCDFRFD